jgi:broad specificity phosphatase PhoE
MHRLLALLLCCAALTARAQTTTVVLVRHAEKADAPAADPPLTLLGQARAESLSVALAAFRPDAILLTPTTRTRQTAAPLAARFGITPALVPNTGTVPVRADSLADLIRRSYAGKTVVVVGHSNTVPPIIKALGGPAMADLCDAEYDSMFLLVITPGAPVRMIRSTFGPKDSAEGPACAAMRGGSPNR